MKGTILVWLAVAWLITLARPVLAGEVSCEGFILGYDGEAKSKTCSAKDNTDHDLVWETKDIDVVDQTFSLWVRYRHAGTGTYFHRRSIEELLAGTSFTHVQKWGVSRFIGGMEVVAFNGVDKGDDYEMTCAMFARYYGQANVYNVSGTKDTIYAIYCAEPGMLTPDQQGTGFYAVMDQVIAKIRLPPDQ